MYQKIRTIILAFLILFLGIQTINVAAQEKNRNEQAWPDLLVSVTLTGTVIIDLTHQNIYFLDVDNDGIADFNLAFGPDWYEPESGATRPDAGDYVTIVGAVNEKPAIPLVIVFEINELLWREPVENWWQHHEWCDNLEIVTVTGKVLFDATYYYDHYYLDVDSDEVPDYQLCFGPPWYEPKNGAVRPEEGATVTIEGVIKGDSDLPCLEVFTIDGLEWREPKGPAPWSGGWIGKDLEHFNRIHCPVDTCSWIEIPPGAWQGGGQQGPQFPDSIYCEFMKVWRDSLPDHPDSVLAGWHFYFSNPAGHRVNGKGVPVRFIKRLRVQLRYADGDLDDNFLGKVSATSVQLRYWDENTYQWLPVEEVSYDLNNQVVQIETEEIQSYYAVFETASVTAVVEFTNNTPENFVLEQNYPNPFNPTTTIGFQINSAVGVKLSIFNMMGQEVRMLVNEFKPVGSYQVTWDGRDNNGNAIPTGQYFYKLQAGNETLMKQMTLVK
jgi:hypothetical protein